VVSKEGDTDGLAEGTGTVALTANEFWKNDKERTLDGAVVTSNVGNDDGAVVG
jgi:hypothetical protein